MTSCLEFAVKIMLDGLCEILWLSFEEKTLIPKTTWKGFTSTSQGSLCITCVIHVGEFGFSLSLDFLNFGFAFISKGSPDLETGISDLET
jgi:hypothetical protein